MTVNTMANITTVEQNNIFYTPLQLFQFVYYFGISLRFGENGVGGICLNLSKNALTIQLTITRKQRLKRQVYVANSQNF